MDPGRHRVAGLPGAHTLSTRNSIVHSPTSGRRESLAARMSGAVVVGVGNPPAQPTIEQRRRAGRTLGIIAHNYIAIIGVTEAASTYQ
jgi:hypothetical protein